MAIKDSDDDEIAHPVSSEELYSEHVFFNATVQPDYELSAVDYMRLKNRWVSAHSLAVSFVLATFGYLLSVVPKWYSNVVENGPSVSNGEYMTLAIGCGLSLICCIVGWIMPNESKEVMKSIDDHFKNAPKYRQRFRGQK